MKISKAEKISKILKQTKEKEKLQREFLNALIEIDRDVNSANNILKVGIKQLLEKIEQVKEKGEGKLLKTLSVDSREVTPVERIFVLVESGSPLL